MRILPRRRDMYKNVPSCTVSFTICSHDPYLLAPDTIHIPNDIKRFERTVTINVHSHTTRRISRLTIMAVVLMSNPKSNSTANRTGERFGEKVSEGQTERRDATPVKTVRKKKSSLDLRDIFQRGEGTSHDVNQEKEGHQSKSPGCAWHDSGAE
ncbi:hypothetical protein EW146_g5184 [Bondarzewia mesenterica]|uniref:Uncharacterized protein n=1 Tax=Bondarzewia mesenterica TaxID=1095465 RepID=A0A4S4LS84_9AGAM|nr:hypothetical protein EW146_g5184 [Bondarzewia mesenterica]